MLKNIRLILLKFVSSQTDRESAVFLDEQANIIITQGCQRQISIKQMHTNPLKMKKTSGFHREGDLSSERGASRRSQKKQAQKIASGKSAALRSGSQAFVKVPSGFTNDRWQPPGSI